MRSPDYSADYSLSKLLVIGWREVVALPDLGISQIEVKVDTGAKSSALNAVLLQKFQRNSQEIIRFKVYPYQQDTRYYVTTEAKLLEHREVRNSGGEVQIRPVILTTIELGGRQWEIELSLTNRDVMKYPMLLGRQAVRDRFLVHPGKRFIQSHQHQEQ